MAGTFVQLRLDPDLAQRLDDEAKRTGMTRSGYVRFVLETHFGTEPRVSMLRQIAWSIQARLKKRWAAVQQAVLGDLENILLVDDEEDAG